MPEDAHYRLAVALALGATALRAREELGVIGASWKVERRASHALAQELKSIRASANTRLVAILGALCAVAAVTKPSEKSFDAFREKLERALTTEGEDETEAVGTVSLWGRATRAYKAYARAVVGGWERGDRSAASFVRGAARAMGDRKRVMFGDYVLARTAKVDDSHAYVGAAGYWWGPFPSFNRAKRAGEDFVDTYGCVIADVAARTTDSR